MIKMEFVKCCVCNSDNFLKLYTIKRYEGTFDVAKCKNCGHVYQNPRPKEREIKKFYNKKKDFYRSMQRKTNIGAFNLINNKRLKTIEKFSKKGNLLDIGCSFGTFPKTAENRGWEAYGNDVSKHLSDFAKREMKLNVFHGTLEKAKYQKKFFDAITMFDVLEHLPNPEKTLKECNRILKNNGLFVIQTPAIDSLYAKIKGGAWDYYGLQHLNYFSKKSLDKLFKKTNFRIIKTYYGDEIGFMTSLKAYLLNKENKRGISILRFILMQLFRRMHIGNLSFGSRVYYVIKM